MFYKLYISNLASFISEALTSKITSSTETLYFGKKAEDCRILKFHAICRITSRTSRLSPCSLTNLGMRTECIYDLTVSI